MTKHFDQQQQPMRRRQFVMASLLLSGILMSGCAVMPASTPPKILFVCQYGTAKSAIAREVFRQRAKQRGMIVDVFSRGITLEDHISSGLRDRLRADGIDSNADLALVLSPDDLAAADILIRFNPLSSTVEHQDVRDWSDLPSVNDDYENARMILNKRIDALLDEIADRKRRF